MLSYMHEAKPVLASVNHGNDLKDILEKHQAGMVCFNGEDAIFADYARQLVKSEELRKRLGSNGRSLLENVFSVSGAASQIYYPIL